jgi:hypothetical protein
LHLLAQFQQIALQWRLRWYHICLHQKEGILGPPFAFSERLDRVKHTFHPKCGSVPIRAFNPGVWFVQRPIWAITAARIVALFATSVLPGPVICQRVLNDNQI